MKNLFIKILLRFLPCAFVAAEMNRVHIGTVTLWVYKSPDDTVAQMVASAYFNNHASLLRQGDVIHVVDIGTGMSTVTVTSADNATPVTVA